MSIADLLTSVERYLDAAAPLDEWQRAWDHGALSGCEEDAFEAMKLAAGEALVAARARWDAASAQEIADYEARLDAGGAALDADTAARAAATRRPARAFDAGAIAAVLRPAG